MSTGSMEAAKAERSQSDNSKPSEIKPIDDLVAYLREYARQKPCTSALVCIGIGFILGWKLKPW
jgi:hypothetical protein